MEDPYELVLPLKAAREVLSSAISGGTNQELTKARAAVSVHENRLWNALYPRLMPLRSTVIGVYRQRLAGKGVHPMMEFTSGTPIASDEEEFLQNFYLDFFGQFELGKIPRIIDNELGAYIHHMARNMAGDQLDKQNRRAREVPMFRPQTDDEHEDRSDELPEDEEKKPYNHSDEEMRRREFEQALVECRDSLPEQGMNLREALDVWTGLWEDMEYVTPVVTATTVKAFRSATGETRAQILGEVARVKPPQVTARKQRMVLAIKECLKGKGYSEEVNDYFAN